MFASKCKQTDQANSLSVKMMSRKPKSFGVVGTLSSANMLENELPNAIATNAETFTIWLACVAREDTGL